MPDYARLNNSVMATFAEPVTFHPPGGDVLLDAVLEHESSAESIGPVGIRNNGHTLMLPSLDLQGTGIAPRQTVTVRGKTYAIKSIGDDIDGMATLPIALSA